MAMRARRRQALTVAEQYFTLRANPVCRGVGKVRAGRLEWRFAAQPTPLSRHYQLCLTYQQGKTPDVRALSPDLVDLAGSRRLPHVYQQRPTRLCLYLPREREWEATMRMDQTIVPWAILWLFYFEDWLVSNEWKGGGEHPPSVNSAR